MNERDFRIPPHVLGRAGLLVAAVVVGGWFGAGLVLGIFGLSLVDLVRAGVRRGR